LSVMNWYKKAKKFEEVSLKGTLCKTKDGFVYLNIPEGLMKGLFSLIDEEGIEKPPYHLKEYNSVGTHVTVINQKEFEENDLDVKEIGQEYNFTLGEFKSTKPDGWDEVEEVYFVQIFSDELEKLRKKYGLTKKIDGHEFHITIAIDKK